MRDIFSNNGFNYRPEDGLRIISRCPVCQKEHNPTETFILDENNGAHLIYIKCHHCSSGVVAMVSLASSGITSLGLVTDLSSKEITTIKDLDKIDEEDVISLYKYIDSENMKTWTA